MRWRRIKKRDDDLERELRADLEMEEEEQCENGLTPEESRQAAIRAFGNVALIRERTHEAWGWATLERLGQDIRYAYRQLRRSPGFSIVAVMTLALGIGATTAIFTLVYDVMLRPLPFAQADRIVNLQEIAAEWSSTFPTLPVSANHFTFWQQHNRSFDAMAVMQQRSAPLGADGRPSKVGVLVATPGLFAVLGVQPQLGRAFTEQEAQPGNDHVAVLMYDLWRQQFSGDPAILGRTIRLNGFPYTVIGVMPQSFHMPLVQSSPTSGDTNRPLPIGVLGPLAFSKELLAEQMGDLNYFGLARLKPGVSVAAAKADLDTLQSTISASLPADEKATLSAVVTPFQTQLVGNDRKPLIILLVAVAGLLLVGCVNVTNLLLARAVGQRQQMAVAAALGAGRAELVRMALRETAVLAAFGGGLGVLLAQAIMPVMQRHLPPALDFRGPLHLDWAGVGCALFLALAATLLAGTAPAFMISNTAPNEVLHTESRLASESRGSRSARRILVGFEVAVSVASQRFEMDLLLLFAASALFLAGVGVYGVVMYSVAQRSREIGLRIALGAQRASVYRLVLRDGLFPVVVGAAGGIAAAFGSARIVSSLLFQVSPYDPALAAGAVCALLTVGTAACLPAARPPRRLGRANSSIAIGVMQRSEDLPGQLNIAAAQRLSYINR